MRTMRYRLELETGDEGYLIYNAETTWNAMPTEENLKRPSIRVKNAPWGGEVVTDFASCVQIDDYYETEPEFDGTSMRFLHDSFKTNYLRIIQGEFPNWVLSVVRIGRSGITLAFFDRETRQEEDMFIEWAPQLSVIFEVNRLDGSGVDTYLAQMSTDRIDTEKGRRLKVIEHDAYGRREISFAHDYFDKCTKKPGEDWDYVYVTEYH